METDLKNYKFIILHKYLASFYTNTFENTNNMKTQMCLR